MYAYIKNMQSQHLYLDFRHNRPPFRKFYTSNCGTNNQFSKEGYRKIGHVSAVAAKAINMSYKYLKLVAALLYIY